MAPFTSIDAMKEASKKYSLRSGGNARCAKIPSDSRDKLERSIQEFRLLYSSQRLGDTGVQRHCKHCIDLIVPVLTTHDWSMYSDRTFQAEDGRRYVWKCREDELAVSRSTIQEF